MIKTIAHLSDIHLMNKLEYQTRQKQVLENTITKLTEVKPDRIVIVGDLFHDFNKVNNETKKLGGWFLNELSKISQVIITLGNHDLNMKAVNRVDSVNTVINLINNPRVNYYDATTFYNDDNIIWSVWHHSDKTSPWVLQPDFTKPKDKLVIDLFHDPINGSKTFFGQEFEDSKYVSLDDFKGDLLLMGDIHQYQLFYNKNNTIKGAYPSSLYQNNYGESVNNHGFILWDITDAKNITHEYIEVENEYSYINYYLKPISGDNVINYDNLNIELDDSDVKKYTHIKVDWTDEVINFTSENWRKIRTYINSKYPTVVEIKKKENKIKNNKIVDNDFVRKSLVNISSYDTQQQVFRQHLLEKEYEPEFIDKVIEIDNKINKRLGASNSVERKDWRIESFYIDNYRSHADRFEMNWDNNNGLYQIMGENAVGKTNMLSAILYLLHAKTLETLKRETNGDNRFINNKRDLDYCEVGGVINIDDTRLSLIRRTERKWDRSKTKITACPTTLKINLIDSNGEIINQTDEEKSKTQEYLTSIIGSFDDFLALYLVNADTLNNLLSMDESVFMDSILKYSGLDIFERKLIEYKEYKKELYKKEEKIVIKVEDELVKIQSLKDDIQTNKDKIKEYNESLIDKEKRLKTGQDYKENELKKLFPIDKVLVSTSLEKLKQELEGFISQKDGYLVSQKELQQQISILRDTYNIERYNALCNIKDSLQNEYIGLKSKIKETVNNIDSVRNNVAVCNGNVLIQERTINSYKNDITKELTNLESKIKLKEQEIGLINKQIDSRINNILSEIEILDKSKICPSCDRELGKAQLALIQNKINDKKNEIILLEESKDNTPEILNILKTIEGYKNNIVNQDTKEIVLLNKQINDCLVKIQDDENKKLVFENEIVLLEADVVRLKQDLEDTSVKMSENQELIVEIEKEKEEFDKRQQLVNQVNNIPLLIENIDLKIGNNKNTYNRVILENNKVIENEKVQKVIDTYDDRLKVLQDEVNNIKSNISYIENNVIVTLTNNIKSINDRISKFQAQELEEQINNCYVECIHRDGVPRLLLLNMRDDINNEIHNLINDLCNFNVYFDENMSLKMYSYNDNTAVQNVIGGSGMERTFISIILRLALRSINNKSLGNFLFLDEVTGKLVGDSVSNFFELIHKIKEKIEKIVIIEHAYSDELNVDYSLTVVADEKGCSQIIVN
jgi:DNA repair exonuclease SbcCD ATPase subunit